MSLVFDGRGVSVGPAAGFQGGGGGSSSSPAAYVSNKHRLSLSSSSSSSSSSNGEEITRISCFSVDPDLSSDNSSVDGLDDSDDDDENEAGSNNNLNGALSSMDSLEDSLPIKRGLSNYFTGKSKSFGNLSEVTSLNSLAKTENPFNKRRRTLIAYKLSRSRNFYSSTNPISMPLLTLHEDEDYQREEDEEEETDSDRNKDDESEDSDSSVSYVSNRDHRDRKIKSYKPTRSFSLTDLHG